MTMFLLNKQIIHRYCIYLLVWKIYNFVLYRNVCVLLLLHLYLLVLLQTLPATAAAVAVLLWLFSVVIIILDNNSNKKYTSKASQFIFGNTWVGQKAYMLAKLPRKACRPMKAGNWSQGTVQLNLQWRLNVFLWQLKYFRGFKS